ncbi:recombinase RecT [Pseudomonas qingdaonensis]|uniref:recombinase RecT n=1 Tax=Pseudomonas qingdaonensis TaxID=2056231 RepID=UPI00265DE92F|nr:recombinase RecT [Pseudomonas qingdaonensis]WKL67258.1 recombinase RecT [Pseudomonas qingdaonensis]
MSEKFQNAVAIIAKQELKFNELVQAANTDVVFKQEMLYAAQAMMNNDYLCSVALSNPLSLRNAFSQVAACGLTLNPARGLCYLVPREGQVVLDVSYKGMIKTAVNDGAIRDCIVELVYSKDTFQYKGKRHSPVHEFDPFDTKEERGEFRGVYVEVTLPDGRVHVEAVTAAEIWKARDASELWKRKKKGPWLDFETSMCKKSGIKIAKKYWPQVGEKLDTVIQYLNTTAGEGFGSHDVPASVVERYMGAADVVGETQPLPTSNEEGPVVAEQPAAQAAVVEPAEPVEAEQAPAEVLQAENAAPEQATAVTEADLPPKVIAKAKEVLKRASKSGGWEAAIEYVSTWPVDARNYATRLLQAARYEAATSGE